MGYFYSACLGTSLQGTPLAAKSLGVEHFVVPDVLAVGTLQAS